MEVKKKKKKKKKNIWVSKRGSLLKEGRVRVLVNITDNTPINRTIEMRIINHTGPELISNRIIGITD